MDKIIEKVIEDFKRASLKRKEKIAGKYGFTIEEFIAAYIPTSAVKQEESPTDVVVAFDTTGSMATYIHSVREHIKELIPKMFKDVPNLKMKIVAFGDYCDMPNKYSFGNAYQETELTNSQDLLTHFVINAKSTSGGDSDEFYELVIKKIVEETAWRNGKRSVLLIADYTPHAIGYSYSDRCVNNQIDWRIEAKKAASLGIQFDTLKIIPSHTWYNELSEITGGACMDFKNAAQVHNVMMASTYARGSHRGYTAMYSSAVERGDHELVGAMKTMNFTHNFTDEERKAFEEIDKEKTKK